MIQPTFKHAEVHDFYLPKNRNPVIDEVERIALQVNQLKVQDPQAGSGIYDDLVDHLVKQSLAMSQIPEHEREPADWTAVQRVVWRASRLSYERKADIVADTTINTDVKAYVIANTGRWIVMCPFAGCNGSQYASIVDYRFWCVDCNNKAIGGQWVATVWPDNVDAIEQALSVRPLSAQNWTVGETIDDLMQQNEAGN